MAVVLPEPHRPAANSSQADWLRSQVHMALDGAVEADFEHALSAAQDAQPHSLHGFLRTFAEAYRTESPDRPLADLFGAPDLSGERLIRYLQQRFAHVSGMAALPRLLLLTYAAAHPSPDRTAAASAFVGGAWQQHALATAWTAIRGDVWTVVIPLRTLFPAQPMGP